MTKCKFIKLFAAFLCIGCICSNTSKVQANELSDTYTDMESNSEYDTESLYLNTPYFIIENSGIGNFNYSMKNGKSKITWTEGYYSPDDNITITYDFQIAKNADFTEAETFQTTKASITLKKSQFGKNGGVFYIRARANYNDIQFSDWSETKELTYIKINKTNFPGLYTLLKNGGKKSSYNEKTNEWSTEKVIYDTNSDSWLDPNEIENMWGLFTITESYQKNGKCYTKAATKVSNLEGVNYLKHLSTVSLEHYSGQKIDLSDNPNIYNVNVRGITSTQITVISPTAKTIDVEADYRNKNFTKINLLKCPNAVDITAYGYNGTPNLTLPKVKTELRQLSISDLGMKTLDLNSYPNLQLLYIYNSDITKLKINKCTDLRYLYFWHCEKLKSLDIRKNKELTGLSVYKSPGLTTKTIKGYKNVKKSTINTKDGKWWYGTDEYNKLIQGLWK